MLRLLSAIIATMAAISVTAAEHTVQMKNQGSTGIMVFEPAVLKVAVGDTVTFQPSDMGHNSQSIPSMSPAGAKGWTGGINQAVSVTIETEGVYIYKCQPHLALGMIGVVVAGEATNIEAINAKVPAMEKALLSNKGRLREYLAQAQ
tara:strand:+ start:291 stop:731 length:441 start_codon:yes stop_codon:yes gene_type:complete